MGRARRRHELELAGRPPEGKAGSEGEIAYAEARFAGARAAVFSLAGENAVVPLCIATAPGARLGAAAVDEETARSRNALLERIAAILGDKILLTPSTGEFSRVIVDGVVSVVPARRGIRDRLASARPRIVLIPHLHLVEDGAALADILAEVRSACPTALVIAPGCGHPWRLALYSYLGVDIVDTSTLLPVLRTGHTAGTDGTQEACRCHAAPIDHLVGACGEEEDRVWQAIVSGTLRELVERRAHVEPFLMAALRRADLAHSSSGSFLESGFPVDCEINASSRESLYRPDLRRWRDRLRSRYSAPAGARVLLLSPCSYRKPYASSRTHQKLDQVIGSSGIGHAVHKVVVTSPVGLVPEEIDCLPPAASYDIPVIGVWDANEKEMIATELGDYLARNKYDLVINHVSAEIPALRDHASVTTVAEHPLSGGSLENLLRALKGSGVDEGERKEGRRGAFLARMEALARFQFGTTLGLDNARRQRQPDGFRSILSIRGEEAAVWSERPLRLAAAGGRALAGKRAHLLVMEDIKLAGDLMAPGVIDATPDFRRGDEVAVVARTSEGDLLRATGQACMAAVDILECRRGRAVAVRKRYR